MSLESREFIELIKQGILPDFLSNDLTNEEYNRTIDLIDFISNYG